MDCFWIDTNVVIRFLMKDHSEHSPAANQVMKKVQQGEIQLYLNPIVAAECSFILRHIYQIDRHTIADSLVQLFEHPGFVVEDKPAILEAVQALKVNSRLSFEDAYISAIAKRHDVNKVLTFNQRDFRKLDSEFYIPFDVIFK